MRGRADEGVYQCSATALCAWLTVCLLAQYVNGNPDVPWEDMRYVFGQIMYGGHISTCNSVMFLPVFCYHSLHGTCCTLWFTVAVS